MAKLPEAHSIVVVDDVPEIREILGFLLEESGWFHVVGVAGNGADAITVVARERPDLVILDLDLPGMSGWEALPEIHDRSPESAVVVLSGSVEDAVAVEPAVEAMAAAVLEKGMANRELIGRLLDVLGQRRNPAQTRVEGIRPVDMEDAPAWLAAIADASSDAVIGVTAAGDIVAWNDAAERLYGRATSEVVGRSAGVLVPGDRRDDLEEWLAAIRRGDRIVQHETVHIHADGSRIDVQMAASPVVAADGRVLGGAFVIRDVSAWRQTEAALARAVAQLERRNRELTRSNEELDSFAAIASHDLAQPLQVAFGFLDMVRNDYIDLLPEQGQGWLNQSLTSLDRMRNLVRDILRYARTGSGEAKREEVPLATVVGTALSGLEVAVAERQAQVDVAPDLPAVVGDPGQLSLVFQNVLANAIKYVPPDRRPRVTVACERFGTDVVVRVADNGVGIAPEARTKAFEMFNRAGARDAHGTGLGLAIVKKIVGRHGGTAWIEDGLDGVGTTVCIRLPVSR